MIKPYTKSKRNRTISCGVIDDLAIFFKGGGGLPNSYFWEGDRSTKLRHLTT